MPCTPEKQFPGAWPLDYPQLPACHALPVSSPKKPFFAVDPAPQFSSPAFQVMDRRASLPSNSLEESRRPPPSSSCGPAAHLAKKPPPLRIIVPPTEYCPFSTDLTLPITPLSLPTPVSSSCFTFSDTQELMDQSVSAPPTLAPVLSSCSRDTPVADFASPTSSQFLLMPPTPHLEDADIETAIRVPSLATPAATDEPLRNGSKVNPRPWEVSSSTWLSDLGGYTETDRIFRDNLLGITLIDTESSPASTPALSPSAVSPSSQVSSMLANNSSSLARSPAPFPAALLPYPCTMSSHSSSLARLVLKPTGTEAFPSTLDGLQAWREGVMPGAPRSEEPQSPISEVVRNSRLGELIPEVAAIYPAFPSRQLHPHQLSPRVPRISKSQSLVNHAKMFGGRVKQLITRQGGNHHRRSMDRGISFRVVTNPDSENGSVILITAPPPPYDAGPPSLISHGPSRPEHARSRTASEYSSAIQTNAAEHLTTGTTELGSRRGSNRSALRRLSLAALSTIKRP